jgi:hypothetical protein
MIRASEPLARFSRTDARRRTRNVEERVGGYRHYSSLGNRTRACFSRSLRARVAALTRFDLRSILIPPGARTPHPSQLDDRAVPIARGRVF